VALNIEIKDGKGSGNKAIISREGALNIVQHPHPPLSETLESLPYRERFSNGATTNMNVDGSTNSVDYTIEASNEYNIYIKTIFVEIEDNGAPALNKFGSASALTNGIEWIYFNQDLGEYTLHEGIKTNKEFIKLGIDTAGIGTGTDAFLADVSGGGTSKSYLPVIDLGEMYGMRYGVKLEKGTTDKLIFRINDDLTSLISVDAIAYGMRLSERFV
jgi:hypothetical protein